MSINETPIEQPTESLLPETKPKRITKRGWITLGTSAGALVVAAAIAVPVISSNIARGNALEALTQSEAELAAAYDDRSDAYTELFEATDGAVVVYDESGEFVKVVRAALLADGETLTELTDARTELVELAGLTTAEDGTTVAPEITVPAEEKDAPTPTTVEAINELAAANTKLAGEVAGDADDIRGTVSDIAEQGESIGELTEAVVASGAAYGAKVAGFDKADAASKKGLTTAVTALKATDTPAINRFSTYVSAYDKVKKSHDAKVAAEKKAAAEEAARKAAQQNGGNGGGGGWNGGNSGGSSGGGWNGGGGSSGGSGGGNTGGGSNGGGGSTGGGGGSNGGGSNGGGSAPAPKTPATFQTNGSYVPIGSCDGAFHSSHQVGWGGTSTSGHSLAAQGYKWSATVSGDTVNYYLCF